MSNSVPSNGQQRAEDLLYGFETYDEETRLYLGSLIASGSVPQTELDALREISLRRGLEEWNMLFSCAAALRERSGVLRRGDDTPVEKSLVPFLEEALTGRAGMRDEAPTSADGHKTDAGANPRRKAGAARCQGQRSGVSHFWGGQGDASGKVTLNQRNRWIFGSGAQDLQQDQTLPATASRETKRANGGLRCGGLSEARASCLAGGTLSATADNITSDTVAEEHQTANLPALSSNLVRPHPESLLDKSQPVKAAGLRSPFFCAPTPADEKKAKAEPNPSSGKRSRPPRGVVSSLPIPPLSADRFGLIQEELADDPFRLLIAITFLVRTTGRAAIPVFRQLMERFPGPEALAEADPAEVTSLIHPLGLSVVRCAAVQRYARMWLERPPTRDVRYGVKNYPQPGDGRCVRVGQEFGPEDCSEKDKEQPVDAVVDAKERGIGCAWEIGHLTQGPYALDSWRIFCRDVLLGRSSHWTGKRDVPEFQPEWMRVLPRDKELRACLRWMWMREGWEWDPVSGEREPLREDLRKAVDEGRVGYDDSGNLVILEQEAGGSG